MAETVHEVREVHDKGNLLQVIQGYAMDTFGIGVRRVVRIVLRHLVVVLAM